MLADMVTRDMLVPDQPKEAALEQMEGFGVDAASVPGSLAELLGRVLRGLPKVGSPVEDMRYPV